MFWSTVNFNILSIQLLPTFLRKERMTALLQSFVKPLQVLHDEILYKQQHDGTTISLEKMLNDLFDVEDYDATNHDITKKIYIENEPSMLALYVFQDDETSVDFLQDEGDDTDDDVFLDNDNEGTSNFNFIIFIPILLLRVVLS